LVLAAQALIVLDRAEDAGAEQPVPLRLEGAVVDGLRLLDLAEGPRPDALRAGDGDADLVEALRPGGLAENRHQLVHRLLLTGRARHGGGRFAPCEILLLRQSLCWFSSTLRPSERSSFTSTLKDSGMPASKLSSPRTIAS